MVHLPPLASFCDPLSQHTMYKALEQDLARFKLRKTQQPTATIHLQGHVPAQIQAIHLVQVWRWNEAQSQWAAEGPPLLGHADWVRDVAWAPSLGLPKTTLASAGQDGKALVWAEDGAGAWTPTELMTSEVSADTMRVHVADILGVYVTGLTAV